MLAGRPASQSRRSPPKHPAQPPTPNPQPPTLENGHPTFAPVQYHKGRGKETVKFILVMLLTFGVVSVACSTSPTPTLTPTAGIATPSAPTVTTVAQPTATATPAQVPTPTPRPTAVPTLEPTTTPASTLTLEPTAIPTLEPTSHPTSALEASIHTVQIEFPPWVETSPDIAQPIVLSAVIAKARFLSIEPIIRKHSTWGYVVEMVYRFQVFQYLKGEGSDELVIHLSSGPKYIAFPDWLRSGWMPAWRCMTTSEMGYFFCAPWAGSSGTPSPVSIEAPAIAVIP